MDYWIPWLHKTYFTNHHWLSSLVVLDSFLRHRTGTPTGISAHFRHAEATTHFSVPKCQSGTKFQVPFLSLKERCRYGCGKSCYFIHTLISKAGIPQGLSREVHYRRSGIHCQFSGWLSKLLGRIGKQQSGTGNHRYHVWYMVGKSPWAATSA